MANTIDPAIYTAALPSITNSLKYVLYKESDFPAEAASQTFAAPHPARTVTFPGLEKTNYKFKLLEMSGMTVVAEKGSFDFVPDDDQQVSYKAPVEIEANVTAGFTSGTNTFTFDGSGGTEDWRGYEIYTERVGQGTMKKGTQYSWNSTTGVFTLLIAGDEFQPNELFNVEFGLIVNTTASGIPPQNLFTGVLVVTGATTLTAADQGKKIIIKGATAAFDITLPDISTVSASIPFYFESGIGSHKCVRIKTASGQTIDWMKGARTDVKIGVCETIVLYREPSTTVWRVHDYKGNFLTVGRIITSDADPADEYNCVEFNGASLSITEYARLYEDFVQQLPPSQVCNFADWTTGDNKYKFSYASAGVFKVPDRRNLFARNSDGTLLPGVYQQDAVYIDPTTTGLYGVKKNGIETVTVWDSSPGEINIRQGFTIQSVTGVTETRPKAYITRQFVQV